MKYVMFEVDTGDGLIQQIPVIFPNALVHAEVAKRIERAVSRNWPCKVVAAGSVNMVASSTHGSSETLGLASRREDAEVINRCDYMPFREPNGG